MKRITFEFAVVLTAVLTTVFCYGVFGQAEAQKAPEPMQRVIGIEDKPWIGIDFRTNASGHWLLDNVIIGSPAWRAGLMKGDTIIAVEMLVDGKNEPPEGFSSVMFLALGLATSPVGTEFKVQVQRGENSMKLEKLAAIDMPREKLSIPVAQHLFDHVKLMHEHWKQAEVFWTTISSASYRQFSDAQARQMQGEIARMQVQKLKAEIIDLADKRRLTYEQIRLAIQQNKLAVAQEHLAKLQAEKEEQDKLLSIFTFILGFVF